MVSVFTSPHAAQRWSVARSWLERRQPGERALLITPQPRAGRALLRSLLSTPAPAAAARAYLGIDVWTPRQCAERLAVRTLAQAGLSPITRRAREVLCGQLLNDPALREALGPLLRIADQPSCPQALARTLDTLRQGALEGSAPLAAHAPHLGTLLQAYERALDAQGLADPRQLWQLALRGLREAPPRECKAAVLCLDVSVAWPTEAALLRALCEDSSDGLWVAPTGDRRSATQLAIAAWSALSLPAPQPESACERLQAGLFASDTRSGAPDQSVKLLSAAGEERECVEIARHLLQAAARGVPFDRMAVLPRRASAYHTYLAEACSRAGIPAYFSGAARRPEPSGRALLALLRCREEDYAARPFAAYLALRESALRSAAESELCVPEAGVLGREVELNPTRAGTAASRTASHRWERLLAAAAVVTGGRARFMRRLRGLQAELALEGIDRSGSEEPQAATQDLQTLIDLVEPLLARLDALPLRASLADWLHAIQDLAQAALPDPQWVQSVLAELRPMVGEAVVDTPELDLGQTLRVLRGPLSDMLQRDSGGADGKVWVSDAADARGLVFDVVCVPGLAEKVFPERVREDPLLLDGLRRRLGGGLPTQEDRIDDERLQLQLAVGAARQQLLLSYPRLDLERGRPRVPSFYLLEALRAAEGTLPGYDALMRRAEAGTTMHHGLQAPLDRRVAIDACEHDLATLAAPAALGDRTMRAGADPDLVGSARYLLLTNPHLARALRARARRWTVRSFGPDDGLVASDVSVRAALARHRPSARPFAATTLEQYAHCPYRFYLRALAGLRRQPRPVSIDRMHPLHRAALIDDCQFRILQYVKTHPGSLHDPNAQADLWSFADGVVEAVAETYREKLCPSVDRVFADGVARVHADLRAWLRQLAADPVFVPTHAELALGLPGRRDVDAESRDTPLELDCGLTLRGAIDMIEADRAGGALRATSHHPGRAEAPERLRVDGGRHLQPLLYGLALKAMFPARAQYSARLHYCTARGHFASREVPIDDSAERDASTVVGIVDRAIGEGMLPAAPERDACDRCDYLTVCGPHERERTQRKSRKQLTDLLTLRAMP